MCIYILQCGWVQKKRILQRDLCPVVISITKRGEHDSSDERWKILVVSIVFRISIKRFKYTCAQWGSIDSNPYEQKNDGNRKICLPENDFAFRGAWSAYQTRATCVCVHHRTYPNHPSAPEVRMYGLRAHLLYAMWTCAYHKCVVHSPNYASGHLGLW